MTTAIIIALLFLLSTAATRRIVRAARQRESADREATARLIATGRKARAMVMSLEPTGVVVNNINIQCRIRFRLEPLDGSPTFEGEKTTLIPQTSMPRIGDVLPCWYDPYDRTHFAAGVTRTMAPEQIQLYREFGIPHPFDSSGG